jgi:hypothetical protein
MKNISALGGNQNLQAIAARLHTPTTMYISNTIANVNKGWWDSRKPFDFDRVSPQ